MFSSFYKGKLKLFCKVGQIRLWNFLSPFQTRLKVRGGISLWGILVPPACGQACPFFIKKKWEYFGTAIQNQCSILKRLCHEIFDLVNASHFPRYFYSNISKVGFRWDFKSSFGPTGETVFTACMTPRKLFPQYKDLHKCLVWLVFRGFLGCHCSVVAFRQEQINFF
jgi:hypothetical protein